MTYTYEEFLAELADTMKECGSVYALAQELGINRQYLSDILNRKEQPGPKILKSLNLRKVVTYETIDEPAGQLANPDLQTATAPNSVR
jgi:transcriptional regulator with XRE-family HTH domain